MERPTPLKSAIEIGISPCPNDTFIFHDIAMNPDAIEGHPLSLVMHDVQTLNRMVLADELAVSKISAFAWLAVREHYALLNCGGAFGYGCGPVLIAKNDSPAPHDSASHLESSRVVLPGTWTTAHLLFRLWAPQAQNRYFTSYDRIFDEVQSGLADYGVIIHENRFTYEEQGFCKVVDLGQWWETQTGLPIPLGCIAARRDLGETLIRQIEARIRNSVEQAQKNPQATLPYLRKFAREMDEAVLWQHVNTFVNDFSLDLGKQGRQSLAALEERGRQAGILT